jgi:KUP system potassium uptake protein
MTPAAPEVTPAPEQKPPRVRRRHHQGMAALSLGALGIVFGDIGTSPLYALQTVFAADRHAVRATESGVYGVISLVFWAITIIVSIKYVVFIMRADNEGEGGIMALIALIRNVGLKRRSAQVGLVALGIFGASLFYGDGMITPAISVLSAVEGIEVVEPSLHELVVPVALAILTLLFAAQRFGTGAVGRLFGPVMAVWFTILAIAGLHEVVMEPEILGAISPTYGISFLFEHGHVAFIALGSVVLTVTGAEALYADMGHFCAGPIRYAWFAAVFPALVLNYMGQGALLLHTPSAIENPFFLLFPHWSRIPVVALATVATVIASQAVISGAFSVTRQAI